MPLSRSIWPCSFYPVSSSYRQIFKSTSLVGGAQVINILMGIVRMKFLALWLGPAGVGIVGLYTSVTTLAGTVVGVGVSSSGVRQIAEAAGTNDRLLIARTAITLQRISWLTGLAGFLVVASLAKPVALFTFTEPGYSWGMAVAALVVFFEQVSAGQRALLQGLRRIKELAICQLAGALAGVIVGLPVIYVGGVSGIPAYLVVVALAAFAGSWWFARRVNLPQVSVGWRSLWGDSRPMLVLGAAFMLSGILVAATGYFTRWWVGNRLGLESVGLYQATYTLSSIYVGVVLTAMGADFFPRLTGVANDHGAVNRMVNEQTEIGILMTLPGVLGTLLFAPWVLKIFYSGDFASAADVIRWQILGVGLRVVSWPLGFVQLALGRSRLFAATELFFSLLHILLTVLCLHWFRLKGVGVAFFLMYACLVVVLLLVCHRLTRFVWSNQVTRYVLVSVASVAVTFVALLWLNFPLGLGVASLVSTAASIWCLLELRSKLGLSWSRLLRRQPQS